MKQCLIALVCVVAFLVLGCGSETSPGKGTSTGTAPEPVNELRIALVPSDDTDEMMSEFEKLRAYLEKDLKIKVSVSKVTSYAACIEAMKKDRVDVAWFGPTSYILAEREANAEAFMVSVDSKGVWTYQSYILVPQKSTVQKIEDLKGGKLALVEASSTSGGLIPSYLILKATGTPANKFCQVTYVGNHDAVVNVVKQGLVDAGATNNLTVDRMVEQGKVKTSEFRILLKSDPIPGSPMAWRKNLPQDFKDRLATSIIAAPKTLGTFTIAGFGEIKSFRRIEPKDYQVIHDIADKLALKREELLK